MNDKSLEKHSQGKDVIHVPVFAWIHVYLERLLKYLYQKEICDLSLRRSPLHKRQGVEYSALSWGCLISHSNVQLIYLKAYLILDLVQSYWGPVLQLCAFDLIVLESVCHLQSKWFYWDLVVKCMGFLVLAGQRGSPILHRNTHILISCPHCLMNRQPWKAVRASLFVPLSACKVWSWSREQKWACDRALGSTAQTHSPDTRAAAGNKCVQFLYRMWFPCSSDSGNWNK